MNRKCIGYDQNNEPMYALSWKETAIGIVIILLAFIIYIALVGGAAHLTIKLCNAS